MSRKIKRSSVLCIFENNWNNYSFRHALMSAGIVSDYTIIFKMQIFYEDIYNLCKYEQLQNA